MKIYIELVIPLVLLLIFVFWKIWFGMSKKRIFKKYKPDLNISKEFENDKNGKGGVFGKTEQGGVGTTEHRVEPAPLNSVGFEQPEGRELLQKAIISAVGEDSSSTRENSSNVRRRRRLFRRYKKK